MNLIIQWAIKMVLNWAHGLSREDLAVAESYVQQAQKKFYASSDKKKWVTDQIKAALPTLTGRAVNFLIEMAVAKLPSAKSL